MSTSDVLSLNVTTLRKTCPIGEKYGERNMAERKIPVLSCEGFCIRGEIARLAANALAKESPYRRACHGELFTAPHSAIARWVRSADQVVLIDGCFMGCHGRILENLIGGEKLRRFDALSYYRKYTDIMESDDVPEGERKEAARLVADTVLSELGENPGGRGSGRDVVPKQQAVPPGGVSCSIPATGSSR